MKTVTKVLVFLLGASLLAYGAILLLNKEEDPREVPDAPLQVQEPGSIFTTTINSEGIGEIVLRIELPLQPRYESGAPVLVYVPTSFTPDTKGFGNLEGVTQLGMAEVTLLYPGRSDGKGLTSAGTDDFGGPLSLQALKDTILFAHNALPNVDGQYLKDLSAVSLNTDNLGLYAFSHPGIAAVKVLNTYPAELSFVDYLVGRENPTVDTLSALELGYEENGVVITNPLYKYPQSYSSEAISLDYSSVQYDLFANRPYLDLNWNRKLDAKDFILGEKVPTLFGKRYYSEALLSALEKNKVFAEGEWPADLATAQEAAEVWALREPQYDSLPENLKVLLVFGQKDHVQVLADKPHIHQSYDGFTEAGLWVRLNPDASYVESVALDSQLITTPEHAAKTQPVDWMTIQEWGHEESYSALVPLAAVAEMADRSESQNWTDDLTEALFTLSPLLNE